MVQMPSSSELGARLPRAVRGQPSYPASSPVGNALQGLGATIAKAGVSLAAQDRSEAEKTQALGIQSRLLQFEDQWMTAAVDRVNNAQPGAAGFTDTFQKDYQAAARQFFGTVPEELKPVYDQKLFEIESRLLGKARTFEREEADRFAQWQVADGQNVLLNRQAADPSSWQQVEQEGEALIRTRPGASPIEADEEVRAWRQRRALQLFQTRSAIDEAERTKLGVPSQAGGSADAVALLRKFEGFRSGTYWDVNAHRTGYGSDTITRADGTVVPVKQGDTVTREDAERDLARRSREFEQTAAGQVGPDRWAQLPGNARAALTSVAYNYGRLPESVVNAVRSGDIEQIAGAVEGLRGHNGGINAKRRQEEANIIRGQGAIPATEGVDTSLLSDPAPEYAALSFEDRLKLFEQSLADEKRRNAERAAQDKFDIGVAETNAPVAFSHSGSYSGQMPSMEKYISAYGEQEGVQRYRQFEASVETSRKVFDMRAAPASEIDQMVADAQPISNGPTAALEQKRYEALSSAREAIFKAREADPAGYVIQTFPAIGEAFDQAAETKDYAPAVRMSMEAQQSLGVQNIQPMSKKAAESAVGMFKDDTIPEMDRIAAISSPIMAVAGGDGASDIQRAIFDQMVAAGLPELTEGAMEALARGDEAAATRLFRAATVDVSKLPGEGPKPAEIDTAVQSRLLDEGQVGDLYYGLSDGSVENFERAQRDAKLLNNAINIRVRNGETLEAATDAAAKDLFGDVKVLTGDSRVNAQVLVPSDEEEEPVLEGFAGLMPQVEQSLRDSLVIPADAPTSDATKPILGAAKETFVQNVLARGVWRNVEGGFAFIDPVTGTYVKGPDEKPRIFTMAEVMGSRLAPAPAFLPNDPARTVDQNAQDEMRMQEEQVRKMYEGAQ